MAAISSTPEPANETPFDPDVMVSFYRPGNMFRFLPEPGALHWETEARCPEMGLGSFRKMCWLAVRPLSTDGYIGRIGFVG